MGNLAHGLMLRFVYLGDKAWCRGTRQPTTLFAGHEHCGSVHWLVFLIYLFYCFVCMRGRMGRGVLSIPLNLFFWRRSFSLNLGNHSFSDRLEISEPQNIILRSILFFEVLNSEDSSQLPESSGINFCLWFIQLLILCCSVVDKGRFLDKSEDNSVCWLPGG